MSHLDTAAITRCGKNQRTRTTHFVGSLGRCLTVVSTSTDLAFGDRTDGPPHAQLLVVCEAAGAGDAAARLNSLAIDTITRELLRHDEWLLALCGDRARPVTDALELAMRAAAASIAATQAGDDTHNDPPKVALTLALVAWPFVAVACAGDGAAVQLSGGRRVAPRQPTKPLQGCEGASGGLNRLGGGEPLSITSWSAELDEEDLLLLGTRVVAQEVFSKPELLNGPLPKRATAGAIAEYLVGKASTYGVASVAVAKLSDGDAEGMELAAERATTVDSDQSVPSDTSQAGAFEAPSANRKEAPV